MDLRGLKGFGAAADLPSDVLKLGIVSGALTEAQASGMATLFPGIRFEFLGHVAVLQPLVVIRNHGSLTYRQSSGRDRAKRLFDT